MSNHTPGPWNYDKSDITGRFSIYANGPLAYSASESDYGDAAVANARLLAAAPDLLYALKFLLADYQAIGGAMRTGSTIPSDYAESAIKKAEGVK